MGLSVNGLHDGIRKDIAVVGPGVQLHSIVVSRLEHRRVFFRHRKPSIPRLAGKLIRGDHVPEKEFKSHASLWLRGKGCGKARLFAQRGGGNFRVDVGNDDRQRRDFGRLLAVAADGALLVLLALHALGRRPVNNGLEAVRSPVGFQKALAAGLPVIVRVGLPVAERVAARGKDHGILVRDFHRAGRIHKPCAAAAAGIVGGMAVLGAGRFLSLNERQAMDVRPLIAAGYARVALAEVVLRGVLLLVAARALVPVLVCVPAPVFQPVVVERLAVRGPAVLADRLRRAGRLAAGMRGLQRLRLTAGIHLPVAVRVVLPVAQRAGVVVGVLAALFKGFRALCAADRAGLAVHGRALAGRGGLQVLLLRFFRGEVVLRHLLVARVAQVVVVAVGMVHSLRLRAADRALVPVLIPVGLPFGAVGVRRQPAVRCLAVLADRLRYAGRLAAVAVAGFRMARVARADAGVGLSVLVLRPGSPGVAEGGVLHLVRMLVVSFHKAAQALPVVHRIVRAVRRGLQRLGIVGPEVELVLVPLRDEAERRHRVLAGQIAVGHLLGHDRAVLRSLVRIVVFPAGKHEVAVLGIPGQNVEEPVSPGDIIGASGAQLRGLPADRIILHGEMRLIYHVLSGHGEGQHGIDVAAAPRILVEKHPFLERIALGGRRGQRDLLARPGLGLHGRDGAPFRHADDPDLDGVFVFRRLAVRGLAVVADRRAAAAVAGFRVARVAPADAGVGLPVRVLRPGCPVVIQGGALRDKRVGLVRTDRAARAGKVIDRVAEAVRGRFQRLGLLNLLRVGVDVAVQEHHPDLGLELGRGLLDKIAVAAQIQRAGDDLLLKRIRVVRALVPRHVYARVVRAVFRPEACHTEHFKVFKRRADGLVRHALRQIVHPHQRALDRFDVDRAFRLSVEHGVLRREDHSHVIGSHTLRPPGRRRDELERAVDLLAVHPRLAADQLGNRVFFFRPFGRSGLQVVADENPVVPEPECSLRPAEHGRGHDLGGHRGVLQLDLDRGCDRRIGLFKVVLPCLYNRKRAGNGLLMRLVRIVIALVPDHCALVGRIAPYASAQRIEAEVIRKAELAERRADLFIRDVNVGAPYLIHSELVDGHGDGATRACVPLSIGRREDDRARELAAPQRLIVKGREAVQILVLIEGERALDLHAVDGRLAARKAGLQRAVGVKGIERSFDRGRGEHRLCERAAQAAGESARFVRAVDHSAAILVLLVYALVAEVAEAVVVVIRAVLIPVRVERLPLDIRGHTVGCINLRAALRRHVPAIEVEALAGGHGQIAIGMAPAHLSFTILRLQRAAVGVKRDDAAVVHRDLDRGRVTRLEILSLRGRGVDPVVARPGNRRVLVDLRIIFNILRADEHRVLRVAIRDLRVLHHADEPETRKKQFAHQKFGLRPADREGRNALFDAAGDRVGVNRRAILEHVLLRHLTQEGHGDGHGLAASHVGRVIDRLDRAVCPLLPVGQHDLVRAVQVGDLVQIPLGRAVV